MGIWEETGGVRGVVENPAAGADDDFGGVREDAVVGPKSRHRFAIYPRAGGLGGKRDDRCRAGRTSEDGCRGPRAVTANLVRVKSAAYVLPRREWLR